MSSREEQIQTSASDLIAKARSAQSLSEDLGVLESFNPEVQKDWIVFMNLVTTIPCGVNLEILLKLVEIGRQQMIEKVKVDLENLLGLIVQSNVADQIDGSNSRIECLSQLYEKMAPFIDRITAVIDENPSIFGDSVLGDFPIEIAANYMEQVVITHKRQESDWVERTPKSTSSVS